MVLFQCFCIVSVENLCKWFIWKGGCFSVAETEKFIFWRDTRSEGRTLTLDLSLKKGERNGGPVVVGQMFKGPAVQAKWPGNGE
jgi:hypothetical protein